MVNTRGKFKPVNKENLKGIDTLISFDYMGSSEFEFGALPQSLNKIISQWSDFIIVGTGIRNTESKELFVLCNKNNQKEVIECVISVAQNPYGYKEFCDMKWHLDGSKETRNDFWWDIDHLWMACTSKDKIELLKHSIELVIEKRKLASVNPNKPKHSFFRKNI